MDKATQYYSEWKSWRESLKPYWTQIDKNQEMYEFYKREEEETSSEVSLNTPSTVVESLITRGNDTNLIVNVRAQGKNEEGVKDFEEWVSSILKGAIEDPDIETWAGAFRKIKESYEREYYVKGNAFAEVQWLRKEIDGKVVANGPYCRVLPYKSVIFRPSRTVSTSDVYCVEKYTTWDELKENEGIYTNLFKLKRSISEDSKDIDHQEDQFITADHKVARKVPKIQLLERWEGTKLTVIANGTTIIREATDPLKIGRHPILTSMNYIVAGRPYAYGEIDYIYKTVRAQDTIVNQNIQIINRYLRDTLLVDPNSSIDLDALMLVLEDGGVTYGDPKAVAPVPTNAPPQSAFMTVDVLQQAIERAARWSPYAAGMPSQATDKTQGTMGGIQSLQRAQEPNFQIKLDDIQDTFMQPLARMYFKMIANLMGKEDIRYALLVGKPNEWVAATKGILQGKATLKDMLVAGMIGMEEFQITSQALQELGQDPNKYLVFDADWIIDIRLDNQSEIDKREKTQVKMGWVQWAQQLGVQFSPEKTATEMGRESGIEEPESLYMSEEEKQQQIAEQQGMMQEQQQAQQDQMRQQTQMKQDQAQQQNDAKIQQKMLDIKAKMALENMKGLNAQAQQVPNQ